MEEAKSADCVQVCSYAAWAAALSSNTSCHRSILHIAETPTKAEVGL